MDVSRQQAGRVISALYCAGGLLLLYDFLNDETDVSAHLPLAWHVFPVSLMATLAAAIAEVSAPLDPVWYVSRPALIGSYLVALGGCTYGLMRIVSGVASQYEADDGERELGSLPDEPEK